MRTKQPVCAVNNENGFTIVEVMVALVIFSIGVLGLAAMQIDFIQGNATARGVTEAANRASSKMEELVALQFTNRGTDPILDPAAVDPPSRSEIIGDYTIDWTVTFPDQDNSGTVNDDENQFILIDLTASWNDGTDTKSFGMEMMRVRDGQQ